MAVGRTALERMKYGDFLALDEVAPIRPDGPDNATVNGPFNILTTGGEQPKTNLQFEAPSLKGASQKHASPNKHPWGNN